MGEVTITQHAMERYAERTMGRTAVADIIECVANNRDKIENDIKKMVKYATEVYIGSGATSDKAKNQNIHLYVKDAWFLLLSDDNSVITMFKKDFGFDDETWNKEYTKKLIAAIDEKNHAVDAVQDKHAKRLEEIDAKMSENEAEAKKARELAKQFDSYNEGLKIEKENMTAELNLAKEDRRRFINSILSKRIFG
ncbi:MAG: hypothetical protein LBJ91_02175 [Clostridiales Family XIII bacterium]|nr:hypothetical protein [Clostridiales Family XIII bacterium]